MGKVQRTQRLFAVSRNSQADYQTVTPTGTVAPLPYLYLPISPDDDELVKFEPKTIDDKGAPNREFGQQQFIQAWDTSVTKKLRLTSYWAAWLNFFLFGQITTIADAGGSTNAKRHTSSPIPKATNLQLPAFSFAEEANPAVHHFLYPSFIIESAEIEGNELGFLEVTLQLRGSGERKTTTVNFSGGSAHVETQTSLQHFFNTQGSLAINDGGGAVNVGCQYRRFKVSVKNNPGLDDGYLPGCARYLTSGDPTSGAIRSELLVGDRQIDFEYEADIIGGELYETHLQNQAPLDWAILFAGATMAGGTSKHSVRYHGYANRYKAVTKNFGGQNKILRATISGSAFSDASNNVFDSYVINDTASYS